MRSKVTELEKDLQAIEMRWSAQRAEDLETRRRDWDAMNSRLDKIDSNVDGIRSDIKDLLQRSAR